MNYTRPNEPFPLGSWVRVRYSGSGEMQVIGHRGQLGPKGAWIYRLMIPMDNPYDPSFMEVREDQMELVSLPPAAEA